MSPEEKALLVKTAKIAEENNSILRKMRMGGRIRAALHALYWVIIIALSFGAYYFIEPYVNELTKVYSQVKGNLDKASTKVGDFGKLLQ